MFTVMGSPIKLYKELRKDLKFSKFKSLRMLPILLIFGMYPVCWRYHFRYHPFYIVIAILLLLFFGCVGGFVLGLILHWVEVLIRYLV